MLLLQHCNETVLEARCHRRDFRAAYFGWRVALHHRAHAVAQYQCVDHAGCLRHAQLQGALVDVRRGNFIAAAAHGLAQFGGRALRQQFSFVKQHHVVAAFGFVEVGGAEQHAGALLVHQPVDDVPQLAPRQRVYTDRRLVEQQQRRLPHQRTGQTEFLFHAAGKLAREAFGERNQPGHVHQFRIARRAIRFRHALQVGIEVEVFLHGQVLIQAKALRHVAYRPLHCERLGCGVHAEHCDIPRIRHQQSGGEAHQRGLACGIGPDQSRDHTVAHVEADLLQRLHLPRTSMKSLGNIFYFERHLAVVARHGGLRAVLHLSRRSDWHPAPQAVQGVCPP